MNSLKLISLPLALVACVVQAGGETPQAVAAKSAKDYRTMTLKKDFDAIAKAAAKDFTYVDANGRKANREAALGGMKGFYAGLTIQSFVVSASSARRAEGGVVYIQNSKILGTMKMGGPKPSQVVGISQDEVLLVPQGRKWLTKRVKTLKNSMTVDGKPMAGM